MNVKPTIDLVPSESLEREGLPATSEFHDNILAWPFMRALERPRVEGKFLFVGDEKLWIRGVTYGTFRPDEMGSQFPSAEVVARDFAAMADAGLNAVRVYTVPPRWMLDLAAAHGLRVMIGIPWEQHITFLDDRAGARRIMANVRAAVRQCAAHPAVLCYAVGNEIPASVVRWYGRRRIERFLTDLCWVARDEDPGALVTYVNFPTTEYLHLPEVDFVSFNVYLESKERLAAYLARVQNIAGERPLLMAEIGLDSRRNGETGQADSLAWQIATAFESGCVGAFVFAWTDEWYRGGHDIADWDFGLTTRDRQPKPALAAAARAFREVPFAERTWPKISVVVCSYNGSATIDETLTALARLDYPDYEVIVVDDGSTDETSRLAEQYAVRLIRTENKGLSSARNTGMHAATGEIVAYIDDDAYPDPHWLTYLAASFARTDHAGIGGPNIAPPNDGAVADCIANAPGGPVHVLLSDELAEHIPGCNMAYRRDRLMAIGGFDPRFRVAGDDVDLCWRLQERGWTLGFSPAAVAWHHRRPSTVRYLKQQRGYAKAEALLAEKWPAKYNSAGHLTWHGRLYGRGVVEALLHAPRIYHGTWGSALFQSIYQPAPSLFTSLPLMPEWYFLLLILGAMSLLAFAWPPLLGLLPVFVVTLVLTLLQAARGAARASFHKPPRSWLENLRLRLIVAGLHLLQPAARLVGRIQHGLGPWRWRGGMHDVPVPKLYAVWCETWQATEDRLAEIERYLHRTGAVATRGGDFDRWDFAVRGGLLGSVRALAMVEEHGAGKQLFRLRAWPHVPAIVLALLVVLATTAILASRDGAWTAAIPLAAFATLIGIGAYADCGRAMKCWIAAAADYALTAGTISHSGLTASCGEDGGPRSRKKAWR
jgi:O-antigen biosynthesis protein